MNIFIKFGLMLGLILLTIGALAYFNIHSVTADIPPSETVLSSPQPNISLSCPAAPACILNERPMPEMPLFIEEAKNVAGAHYFESGRYVCQDYAKELVGRLQADGYSAQYCIGIANWCKDPENPGKNCWHAWVKLGDGIYIEATTGQFIEPKDYGRDYDERSCTSAVPG